MQEKKEKTDSSSQSKREKQTNSDANLSCYAQGEE
jgi:hypothetical protein